MMLLALLAQVAVVVENPTPHARTSWVVFTVPEARIPAGNLSLGPYQAFRGRLVGAGVRAIHARPSMGAFERVTWTLAATDTTAAMATDAGPTDNAPAVRVSVNGAVWSPSVAVEQDGPATVLHLRGRIPGCQIVAELWATVYPGAPVVPWELLVVASDPRTTEVYQWVESLTFEVDGQVVVSPWWPRWKGAVHETANRVRLLTQTTIADSQGVAWAGVVALNPSAEGAAAIYGPLTAVASAAAWAGSWGPFGAVPTFPPDMGAYLGRMSGFLSSAESAGWAFRGPRIGLAANSGQTGAQDDFGASKLGWAWAGGPTAALEGLHSALHEASRPGLWYEADAALVEPWAHPNHVTWSGYTHWHSSYSGDRLGKGSTPAPRWSGNYIGPDREHWSNNVLCGTYLLTGSRVLQRVIEKQARQILSGETLDPRLPGTSGIGPPRGIGRTLLSASWIDCCLDPLSELRARVQERILARCEQKIEPWTRPPAGAVVAPLGTTTDPRRMNGVRCWGWEEPLGLMGLRAAELRFGSAPAGIALRRAAESWIRYGWWHDERQWRMADNVAYLDGQAPPASSYPTVTNPVPVEPPVVERTEGFEEWAGGALAISAQVLTGDAKARAETILAAFPVTKMAEAEWRAVR